MKLYYSTYGMKQLDIFEALPRLKDMGYEGMEIAVTPGWPTEPASMDQTARKKLADLLRQLDWPTPALMALLSPGSEGEERPAVLAQFHATFEMSRELRLDDNPMVISTTLGRHPAWETGKERIVELVLEVADVAAEYDALVAIEPHAGDDFETPEKAAWLMEQTNHPNLGLNFDYSHFVVEGIDLQTLDRSESQILRPQPHQGRLPRRGGEGLLPVARRRCTRPERLLQGDAGRRMGQVHLPRGHRSDLECRGLRRLGHGAALLRRAKQGAGFAGLNTSTLVMQPIPVRTSRDDT